MSFCFCEIETVKVDTDEAPMVLYGRQVDAIGRVGAFVPRVHLGGIHTLLVPVHLRDREESVRVRC